MLIACGAVCNVAMLSFMASSAHAQSSFTWTSSSGGNWSNGANWAGGSGPTTGVDSTGDVSLEYNAAGTYTSNNDLGTYGVFNTTFDATNGTTNLTGGQLNLSSPSSEPVNPTFTNNSQIRSLSTTMPLLCLLMRRVMGLSSNLFSLQGAPPRLTEQ